MLSAWISTILFVMFVSISIFGCINFLANSVSDTHIVKALFKGYSRQSNILLLFNCFRRKLGSSFFERLGIFVQENCLWFEIFQLLKVFVKPFIVVFLSSLDCWSIDRITSRQEDESVVESGDGVMFSLDLDCVFVKGYMMRNKFNGLVDCKWRPRFYCKFLWFVYNQLVRIVEHLMIFFTDDLVSLQIEYPLYLVTLKCFWCMIVTSLVVDFLANCLLVTTWVGSVSLGLV